LEKNKDCRNHFSVYSAGMSNIQFVDVDDQVIGAGTRDEALKNGIRHRISRIFLVNANGDVLLAKRAQNLSSTQGLWSQSAGGHVHESETYEEAAHREMKEELGIKDIALTEIGYFYSEDTDTDGPKQFSRIYKGIYEGELHPNLDEISEVKWVSKSELDELIEKRAEEFAAGGLRALKFVRKLL
jgi:isopentenyl-diphosphate delta-isomerase